jgi:hypothetical protein
MRRRITSQILFVTLLLVCYCFASAQSSTTPNRPDNIKAEKSSPGDDSPPLTTMEEEMRAKRAIKYAEKEHKENLDRANEIAQLGKDLSSAFKEKRQLARDDIKRLDRLEKLTKKARGESGGEDTEGALEKKPSDLEAAVGEVERVSSSLSEKIKQTPRQVISAAVIDEANVLLELIKLTRTMVH